MSDIIDNPEDYFRQFIPPRDQLLIDLELEAEREEIPIVGPVVGELLHILAAVTRATRILELGTATGYSAIYMARAFRSKDARLVTLDNDPSMAARAEKNIQKANLASCIDIVIGDAQEQLAEMNDPFDFAFLDIEKEFYGDVLPHCHRLLKPGGLLVADNVAFIDADPFNRAIAASADWQAVNLFALLPFHSPEYDGICIALKRF